MVNKENNNVLKLILGMGFILAFFFTINPLTRTSLGVFLFFLVVSFLVYVSKVYQSDLIGISRENAGKSVLLALGLGIGFWLLSKYAPGASIGLPLLPNAVSDQLKFFIVVFVAPIVEEIFFRGSLLGYIKNFAPSKKQIWIAIIVQAVAFALFHLGAYIAGWYSLPNLSVGIMALSSNIGAFISAFLFALLAGFIVTRDGIKNLLFTIVLHATFNLIIYTSLVVAFA